MHLQLLTCQCSLANNEGRAGEERFVCVPYGVWRRAASARGMNEEERMFSFILRFIVVKCLGILLQSNGI